MATCNNCGLALGAIKQEDIIGATPRGVYVRCPNCKRVMEVPGKKKEEK